jgi:hypothetical protein
MREAHRPSMLRYRNYVARMEFHPGCIFVDFIGSGPVPDHAAHFPCREFLQYQIWWTYWAATPNARNQGYWRSLL